MGLTVIMVSIFHCRMMQLSEICLAYKNNVLSHKPLVTFSHSRKRACTKKVIAVSYLSLQFYSAFISYHNIYKCFFMLCKCADNAHGAKVFFLMVAQNI